MKKIMNWVMAATLTMSGLGMLTACAERDNPSDETQAGLSVKSLGWTTYSVGDETLSDAAFEVTAPAGTSYFFTTLKTRYLDDYSGMSISEMAAALIEADAEATGQTPQLRKGSQTCYGGVGMDGDYVAYVFETTADGTPTGRYAKTDFTVSESGMGAYYAGRIEQRTDWAVTFTGEPYQVEEAGTTFTYVDIAINAPGIGYYDLEAWDEFSLLLCSDMTLDGLMGNLQESYWQLLERHSPGEVLWSADKPCTRIDITGCSKGDKVYLLEFDEHGNATGRYNSLSL